MILTREGTDRHSMQHTLGHLHTLYPSTHGSASPKRVFRSHVQCSACMTFSLKTALPKESFYSPNYIQRSICIDSNRIPPLYFDYLEPYPKGAS